MQEHLADAHKHLAWLSGQLENHRMKAHNKGQWERSVDLLRAKEHVEAAWRSLGYAQDLTIE